MEVGLILQHFSLLKIMRLKYKETIDDTSNDLRKVGQSSKFVESFHQRRFRLFAEDPSGV